MTCGELQNENVDSRAYWRNFIVLETMISRKFELVDFFLIYRSYSISFEIARTKNYILMIKSEIDQFRSSFLDFQFEDQVINIDKITFEQYVVSICVTYILHGTCTCSSSDFLSLEICLWMFVSKFIYHERIVVSIFPIISKS